MLHLKLFLPNFLYFRKFFRFTILSLFRHSLPAGDPELIIYFELNFGDFIKELNKAIKKSNKERAKEAANGATSSGVEMPQLTKKDEFEWMELFEENKKKVLELQREIEKTDKEIDQMVYELYGLTEEEIEIVEGA